MIIDMRTYTYHPATYRPFLKYYRETGYAITSKFLGYNLGLFTASSGVVNRTIQWFAYEDHDHRDRCRQNYLSNPNKIDFTNDADTMIRQQESRVIVPTAFSPLRAIDPLHPLLTDPACERRMFEFTTYECRPGMIQPALEIIERQLCPAAEKHAQWVIAYLTSDSGAPCIYELRAYSTLQERTERNRAMQSDPAYSGALRELSPLLGGCECVIWESMPMSPLH